MLGAPVNDATRGARFWERGDAHAHGDTVREHAGFMMVSSRKNGGTERMEQRGGSGNRVVGEVEHESVNGEVGDVRMNE